MPDTGGFSFQYARTGGQTVHAVDSGIDPTVKDAVRQYLYTLIPGRRPDARRFEPKGVGMYLASMTRSADGTYAAVNLDSVVARLRSDFTTDRTFGVTGVARPVDGDGFAKDFFDPIIYTDARGLVLAFEPAGAGDGYGLGCFD